MKDIVYNIGYFAPLFIFIFVLLKLTKHRHVFFLSQCFSFFVNTVIKNTIRQPRPSKSLNVNRFDAYDVDHFGMPSSHAQLVVGMLTFAMFQFNNDLITAFLGVQALITMWQRYVCRKHTASQLAVGALLGTFIGYYTNQIMDKLP